jgi:hypothetical protein
MPETSFSHLPQHLDRVGAPNDVASRVPGRDDGNTYFPLDPVRTPGTMLPPALEPPPAPAQESPGEADLRRGLQQALETHQAAQERLRRAGDAHQRGRQHLADCQRRDAGFVGLQAEITQATTDQLRTSRGKVDLSLFESRIAERAKAEIELAAAVESESALLREHGLAVGDLQEAERLLRPARTRVTNIERARLRGDLRRLELQVAAYEQAINRDDDMWPWTPVCARLDADPMNADITVTVPDEPVPDPPKPVVIFNDKITLMRPIGAPEGEPVELTHAQFAAMQREAPPTEPFAVREEMAKQRAQGG